MTEEAGSALMAHVTGVTRSTLAPVMGQRSTYLIHAHLQVFQSRLQLDTRNRHLFRLAKRQVSEQDGRVESERVHVF
jgi:hypothetical protein